MNLKILFSVAVIGGVEGSSCNRRQLPFEVCFEDEKGKQEKKRKKHLHRVLEMQNHENNLPTFKYVFKLKKELITKKWKI